MAATIDEQFVEFVVKSLVDHPDDVKINRTIDEQGVFLQLTVHPEDLGRVIGKGGATAQSIRRLLWALGTKNQAKYNFKILGNEETVGGRRESRDEKPSPSAKATEDKETEAKASPSAKATEDKEAETKPVEVEQAEVEDKAEAPAEPAPAEKQDSQSLTEKTLDELKDLDDLDV